MFLAFYLQKFVFNKKKKIFKKHLLSWEKSFSKIKKKKDFIFRTDCVCVCEREKEGTDSTIVFWDYIYIYIYSKPQL